MNKKVKLAMTAVMIGLSVITFTGCGNNNNSAGSQVTAQAQMPKDPLERAKWLSEDVKKNIEAIDKAGDSLAEYYKKDPEKYKLLEPDKYYNRDTEPTMTQGPLERKEVTPQQRKDAYEAAVEVYNKNKKYYDNLDRDKEELEKIHHSKDAVLDDGNKKHNETAVIVNSTLNLYRSKIKNLRLTAIKDSEGTYLKRNKMI
jgi:ABC-type phosphate transport system substrate-binding protein